MRLRWNKLIVDWYSYLMNFFSQKFCQAFVLQRTQTDHYSVDILVIEMLFIWWTTDNAICDFDIYYWELNSMSNITRLLVRSQIHWIFSLIFDWITTLCCYVVLSVSARFIVSSLLLFNFFSNSPIDGGCWILINLSLVRPARG